MHAARSKLAAGLACILVSMVVITVTATPSSAACVRFGGSVVGCEVSGAPGGGDVIDPLPPVADVAPMTCRWGAIEVPCSSYAGTWAGSCYVQAASPQPAFDDPLWQGGTEGVIIVCTPYPCVVDVGDTIPDCPSITRYWAPAAPVVVIDEGDIARRALAELGLEPVTISMAPAPDLADPNVLIRAPAYFWAEGGELAIGPTGTTVTEQGITITLNATLDSVTYDTGDGTTLTCTREQVAAAPSSMSLQGEPDCGHRWASPGTYALTATSAWTIAWQGPTQNGTFDYALDSTIDVAVTDRPVNLTTEKTP